MRWDQEDLAEKSGVSRGYISEIERGVKKNVGVEVVFLLAGALGVTVPYLLGLTDDPLGEGMERVQREQAGDYVIFEVETSDQRRTLQQLIDEYTALSPRNQRQALSYLRMMRQLEEKRIVEQQGPRRRILSAINRLNIALAILWLKVNRRRWFIEYDGEKWEVISD
jgi:transcriptional regulator with XRE-family HTH domain